MSQMVTLKRPHQINVTTQIVQSFSSQPSRFDETFHAYMSAETPEAKREDLMRKASQTAAGTSYFFILNKYYGVEKLLALSRPT